MLNLIFALACANGPESPGDVASGDLAGAQELGHVAAAEPLAALPSKPVQSAPVDLPLEPAAGDEVPAGADKVQALLMARHNGDLPDKAAIDFHGDGQAILEHLALTPASMLVQERALVLRGLYPGARFCVDQAVSGAHPKLQAAAVRCLAGQQLTKTEQDDLSPVLESEDPRIQSAVLLLAPAVE